ncbi:hypothetical protein ACVWXN_008286 [Bradyrhizobium sp. i1.4.4]
MVFIAVSSCCFSAASLRVIWRKIRNSVSTSRPIDSTATATKNFVCVRQVASVASSDLVATTTSGSPVRRRAATMRSLPSIGLASCVVTKVRSNTAICSRVPLRKFCPIIVSTCGTRASSWPFWWCIAIEDSSPSPAEAKKDSSCSGEMARDTMPRNSPWGPETRRANTIAAPLPSRPGTTSISSCEAGSFLRRLK